jgi:F-type H+-transporting ATPase subunit delta
MATSGDKIQGIARLYAEAILRLAEATKQTDALRGEFEELMGIRGKAPDVGAYLLSPTVDVAVRAAAIDKLFRGKLSDLCVDFLQVLNRKDRLSLLWQIIESFFHQYEDLRGRVEVYVRTAVPLPDNLRQSLLNVLTKNTGRPITLHEAVDASLIGGMVVQIGDRKFDMTVAARIRGMWQAFVDRGVRETPNVMSFVG